jgi:hypothetical protein
MIANSVQHVEPTVGHSEYIFFAGDNVQLAGQVDYPKTKMPVNGYPLIFIIQHATCTNRSGYLHFTRMGTEHGMAVFRWDKRGTGNSGGGTGSGTLDAVHAYKTALEQPSIDRNNAVIIAQNEGTLLLAEAWSQFRQLQMPVGVVLAGNMLDARDILLLDTRVTAIVSRSDWNAWQIYAEQAARAHHERYPQYEASYYVANGSNRRLKYEHGGAFHRGVSDHIKHWLTHTCKISPSY